MKKFILVKKGNYDPYYLTTVLANLGVSSRFVDEKFQFYECNISFDTGRLVYIDDKDTEVFLKKIKEKNISFEILDLNEKYDEFTKAKCLPEIEKLDDSFFLPNDTEIVAEEEFSEIRELPDGSQYLTEEEIVRKDCIKLKVHLKETCGHHKPHLHAEYNDVKNFCVIDLKNFSIIEPKHCERRARFKKCIALAKKYVVQARLVWNKSSGIIKFKVINWIPTEETYDSSKSKLE